MVCKICNYFCDLSLQDLISKIKYQTSARGYTLSIMSEKYSSYNQHIVNKESITLIALAVSQSLHRIVYSPVLQPVPTTATHRKVYTQRNKGHNLYGVQR